MPIFNTQTAIAAANNDGEFKLAARLWNADLRLDVGDESYLLRIRDGSVAEFRAIGREDGAALNTLVTISAPLNEWHELLKPVPRPFFQDLMAAQTRHGFKVEGADLTAFNPYYRAINRLFELMRGAGGA
jgi:hypothetical protein